MLLSITYHIPVGFMGLLYLPTLIPWKSTIQVGTYNYIPSSHESHGMPWMILSLADRIGLVSPRKPGSPWPEILGRKRVSSFTLMFVGVKKSSSKRNHLPSLKLTYIAPENMGTPKRKRVASLPTIHFILRIIGPSKKEWVWMCMTQGSGISKLPVLRSHDS